MKAIRGGTVYTMAGPPIENGTVLISNGKITAVGGPELPVPGRGTVHRCSGMLGHARLHRCPQPPGALGRAGNEGDSG